MVTFDPLGGGQDPAFDYQLERLTRLVSDMKRLREGTSVDDLAEGAPLLDRWMVGARPAQCLVGLSTGHPTLTGIGRSIATSDLWLISADGASARTLSRWYRLGDPFRPDRLDS
jgi:hypothetical protein